MRNVFVAILFFGFLSQGASAQEDGKNKEVAEEMEVRDFDNDTENALFEDAADAEVANDQATSKAGQEPKFDLRRIDKTAWSKLKKDKRFRYKKERKKENLKLDPPRMPWLDGIGRFFSSAFFKLLLYVFLAAFLLYIIYLFLKNNKISFRRNVKDKQVVQEDPWEDVTRFEDWELALQKALGAKDYRLATRIYYLHTLHILDKNNVVSYREDKTNWYYVQKLFGTPLHDHFKELTRSFDYIWYGEYQINASQFEALATQFKSFKVQIL